MKDKTITKKQAKKLIKLLKAHHQALLTMISLLSKAMGNNANEDDVYKDPDNIKRF